MLKNYKLLHNTDPKKIFPINNSYNTSDHYKSIYIINLSIINQMIKKQYIKNNLNFVLDYHIIYK